MNILIDIIKEDFTTYIISHLDEKSPLPIIILKALDDSLRKLFHNSDIVKFQIHNPHQLCTYYMEPKSLRELSEIGLQIPYIKIEIWTTSNIKNLHLILPTNIQYLDFKYTDTYSIKYQIKKIEQKTRNKFIIDIKTLFIPAKIFKNIFIKLKHICNSKCHIEYLQETKLNANHYVSGSIFGCKICGEKFACTCCQKGITEYIKQMKDKNNYLNDPCAEYNYPLALNKIKLLEQLHYIPNICHICTQQIPFFHDYVFANTSTFARKYYPYIENMAFQKGAKIFEEISQSMVWREAENSIREKMNYPKIGEKWINETFLYNILKNLFADYQIIREASPSFLGKLRLDFFIPELSLAIEYQGEQHFHPVKRFGGEQSFVRGKQRDSIKRKLCKQNSITLIYFNYFEELDESLVERKLKKFITK